MDGLGRGAHSLQVTLDDEHGAVDPLDGHPRLDGQGHPGVDGHDTGHHVRAAGQVPGGVRGNGPAYIGVGREGLDLTDPDPGGVHQGGQ